MNNSEVLVLWTTNLSLQLLLSQWSHVLGRGIGVTQWTFITVFTLVPYFKNSRTDVVKGQECPRQNTATKIWYIHIIFHLHWVKSWSSLILFQNFNPINTSLFFIFCILNARRIFIFCIFLLSVWHMCVIIFCTVSDFKIITLVKTV